jgi:hypothetical protein
MEIFKNILYNGLAHQGCIARIAPDSPLQGGEFRVLWEKNEGRVEVVKKKGTEKGSHKEREIRRKGVMNKRRHKERESRRKGDIVKLRES